MYKIVCRKISVSLSPGVCSIKYFLQLYLINMMAATLLWLALSELRHLNNPCMQPHSQETAVYIQLKWPVTSIVLYFFYGQPRTKSSPLFKVCKYRGKDLLDTGTNNHQKSAAYNALFYFRHPKPLLKFKSYCQTFILNL